MGLGADFLEKCLELDECDKASHAWLIWEY